MKNNFSLPHSLVKFLFVLGTILTTTNAVFGQEQSKISSCQSIASDMEIRLQNVLEKLKDVPVCEPERTPSSPPLGTAISELEAELQKSEDQREQLVKQSNALRTAIKQTILNRLTGLFDAPCEEVDAQWFSETGIEIKVTQIGKNDTNRQIDQIVQDLAGISIDKSINQLKICGIALNSQYAIKLDDNGPILSNRSELDAKELPKIAGQGSDLNQECGRIGALIVDNSQTTDKLADEGFWVTPEELGGIYLCVADKPDYSTWKFMPFVGDKQTGLVILEDS
ncbi:hypothetical protein [Lentilitoribacter sp. EG35]|uniref:hypothetical protein n=1 Tax=Lentilitoribacter sp. EG35 TaxID=3234192 RepID=UPI003460EFDD